MKRVAKRFSRADGFRLLGKVGFVSDDTEQSALVAQALARGGSDDDACVRAFRRSMVGWFARLPFGIGGATLRACLRMTAGLRRSGVRSAGNGAAMRAGILGVHLADDPTRRERLGRVFASVTHTDERAIQAALFVAEVSTRAMGPGVATPAQLLTHARVVLEEAELVAAVNLALALAVDDATLDEAVEVLGNTGFVVHSLGICTYCFARFGAVPMEAIDCAIRAGGDTDTHAAIVGGWVGALHGASRLPRDLVDNLQDGPFGPTHLRGLAYALVESTAPPRWSCAYALARNLMLYPVVLAHGFARLVPW